jgi:tRNA (guanine26-N2/guanine27-N2)-dimethyltransferase
MHKEVQEGKLKLHIDSQEIVTKQLEVFYNPKMKLHRSLTCAILKSCKKTDMNIALPLAGTGTRALRILTEVPKEQIKHISLNDYNPKAKEIYLKNAKENNILDIINEKTSFVELDANIFLQKSKGFDYIDIDPYGSPNFLLDSAISRLKNNAILAVTATDTAPLSGTYSNTCKRKYWSTSMLCSQKHEIGLRILARKIMLLGTHCQRALKPILAYHSEHYYRIFFIATKSKKESSKLLTDLEYYFGLCRSCGSFIKTHQTKIVETCSYCNNTLDLAGPLYIGTLEDENTLLKIKNNLEEEPETEHGNNKELLKLIETLLNDSKIKGYESFSYDTHTLCKINNFKIEPIQTYIERLEQKGYMATRSCFPITSIKTNAPFEVLIKCFKKNLEKKNKQ